MWCVSAVFTNGLKCDVYHAVFYNGLKCDVYHAVFFNGFKCDVHHAVFYNGLKCDVNHPVFYNGLQFLDHKLSGCESSHSWHWRGGGVRGQLPWILKQAGLWRIKGVSLHIQNIKYMMNTSLKGKNWKILEKKYSPSHIPLIIPLHPPPPVPQLVMPWRPVTCLGEAHRQYSVGTRQAVLWEPWFSLILYLDTVLVCTPLNIRSNIPLFTQSEDLFKVCGSESLIVI